MPIGKPEIVTQRQLIEFFTDSNTLDYQYLGNLKDYVNKNIRESELREYLRHKGYSNKLIDEALDELLKTAGNLSKGLYDANKAVYSLLKYGAKVRENPEDSPTTVYYIDFENPINNFFSVAEEVTVVENQEKRPDVVIYVNGIALVVIELKKSAVSVSNGIRQNLTNQKLQFIPSFFSTVQFCMAGNDIEGLRYGTIETSEKYYLEWKPDGFYENENERDACDHSIMVQCKRFDNILFKQVYQMFYKRRLLDLIENFIVFDKGIKKVCRSNQFYAIKRAQNRIASGQGGIIWHTQGSGKTLTMVWLTKLILANSKVKDPRILIITDRDELDEQIEKTYLGVNEKIVRTKSCDDLLKKLNNVEFPLLCSLIHKFGHRGGEVSDSDYDKYIEELKKSLPADFCAKGKIYVFVDECHRTQSGKLHEAMKTIIPNAIFIGFTGTPLLKKDKITSIEVFGTYIHTYKFNEAVADGVVLDLRYEYRDIPQRITSKEKIDLWFDKKNSPLSNRAKAKIKEEWATMQSVYSSLSRLERIALDIIEDFNFKDRLCNDKGNAILVADSIYSACKYYEIFQKRNFKKCAIISSYTPQIGDLRTDTVSEESNTETYEKYEIYLKMLGLDPDKPPKNIKNTVEVFEKDVKDKFINQPAKMKLLIVVDKLLTGFDAPPCTYLYVDKNMQDHGLFQAVCRVNRLDNDSKQFGYIVDYKQLFGDLKDAMDKYTSGAFENYDKNDVEGLIKDRSKEAIKYFKDIYDQLEQLCEGVEEPKNDQQYLHYFCGVSGMDEQSDEIFVRLREKLYKLVNALIRAFAEAKQYIMNTDTAKDFCYYEKRVRFYIELKQTIGYKSGDFIDLKAYGPDMRMLIDNYIEASFPIKIGEFDDLTLLDFIKKEGESLIDDSKSSEEKAGAAESIENNIRRKIVEKKVDNPKYYEKMSAILEQLIKERNDSVISYKDLLDNLVNLAKNVENPKQNNHYPEHIKSSSALQALYDLVDENEELAMKLHKAVLNSKLNGFRDDQIKERKIKKSLYETLIQFDVNIDESTAERQVEEIFDIVKKQVEY